MHALAALLAASVLVPAPALAQRWSAEAQFGRLDFLAAAAAAPPATSVSFGLRRDSPSGRLRFAGGLPLGEEDPVWALAEVAERPGLRRGAWFLGADLSAYGFLQRYTTRVAAEGGGLLGGLIPGARSREEVVHGFGVAGEAVPVIGVTTSAIGIEAGAGLSYYHGELGEQARSRLARLADVRLTFAPRSPFVVTGQLQGVAVEEGHYSRAGIIGAYRGGHATLWASAGYWLDGEGGTPWAAGASLSLGQRLEIEVYARHDPFDPIHRSAPRRSWGAATRVFLTSPRAPAKPVPAAYAGGRATIVLPAEAVRGRPRIAGDFNAWTPAPMTREGERWTYTVALAPGVYEYAFVSEDGEWFVPESVPGRKDDGMGGHVAILVVQEAEP